jgi:hypothetical protein
MSVLINWLNSITVSLTHFAVRFAIAAIILVVGWFLIGFFAKKPLKTIHTNIAR